MPYIRTTSVVGCTLCDLHTYAYLSKLIQVIILLHKLEPQNLVRELLKEVHLATGDELWQDTQLVGVAVQDHSSSVYIANINTHASLMLTMLSSSVSYTTHNV